MNQSQVVVKLFKEHFGDKPIIGVEIGTKCADLTIAILMNLPNCFLYTIDPWEHRDKAEFEAGEPQSYHDNNKEHAMRRILDPKYKDRVVALPYRSEDAKKYIKESIVDFVWLDGDHSAEGIIKDCDNYEAIVKSGGIFGGHDFNQVHPLTEILQERYGNRIITSEDYTWWIIK